MGRDAAGCCCAHSSRSFYARHAQDWLGGVLAGITLRDGRLAGRVSRRADGLPGDGRVADLARGRADASHAGGGDRSAPSTVLAVDKTGTLTENRMRVALIETRQTALSICAKPDAALDERRTTCSRPRWPRASATPSIRWSAPSTRPRKLDSGELARLEGMTLVREYDLTPELLAVTHVWQAADARSCEVAVKGAPETVLELCRIDARRARGLLIAWQRMPRWIARARGRERPSLRMRAARTPRDFELQLLGLLCLADPLRADVPACARGVRSRRHPRRHDHRRSSGNSARDRSAGGIRHGGGVLTGAEIETLTEDELRTRARTSTSMHA